jgi:hypothetical protein
MTFSWGLENRAASVSIPHSVLLDRRGGYEDRCAFIHSCLMTLFWCTQHCACQLLGATCV